MAIRDEALTIGHSPDADDVFMWWPLTGKLDPADPSRPVSEPVIHMTRAPRPFRAVVADIQALNRRALEVGDLDVTALSMFTAGRAAGRYMIASAGSSMGEGYGPKLVCRRGVLEARGVAGVLGDLADGGMRVAVPGLGTTAFLILSLILGRQPAGAVEMAFEAIPGAVAAGEIASGVLIHEAQLTFGDLGLAEVADFGAWWREHGASSAVDLPLPLGVNAIRRETIGRDGFGEGGFGRELAGILEQSVRHSLEHLEESLEYASAFAPAERRLPRALLERYIRMYVTARSVSVGKTGGLGMARLLAEAKLAGLLPRIETIEILTPFGVDQWAVPELSGPPGDG